MDAHYHLGLLHFAHLLVSADGEADIRELDALFKIKIRENIPEATLRKFDAVTKLLTEREVYQAGLEHLASCSDEEKLKVFATLYRLSEVDGRVHVKEIRLLLYAVKTAGIEFNDVVDFAKKNPSIF
jgi:hypothetical protein